MSPLNNLLNLLKSGTEVVSFGWPPELPIHPVDEFTEQYIFCLLFLLYNLLKCSECFNLDHLSTLS